MLLGKMSGLPKNINDYLYQVKYDGHRCLFHYDSKGKISLFTRHMNPCSRQYIEMNGITLPVKNVVLDGELVVLRDGLPCWDSVIKRFLTKNEHKVRELKNALPVHFVAFDVLFYNNDSQLNKKLEDRLQLLETILPSPMEYISAAPVYHDGEKLFNATKELGLKGLCAKKKGSAPYLLDTRSDSWCKIKHYKEEIITITSIRKKEFGWILKKDDRYVGVAEFVPATERKALYQLVDQLKLNEDEKYIYLHPILKGKVKFQAYSLNGVMRTPSFLHFIT
jgi:DNA ligase-1